MNIRAFALVLCACRLLAVDNAHAQGTDIQIVAPSAPGTGWDHVAQSLRAAMAERGGLAAGVTNLPGGGGLVGLAEFLASRADTDLLVTGLTMLDSTLLSRSSPDFSQLTPIARLSSDYYAVAVAANSPLKSLQDLGAVLASDPAKLTWGGGPAGGLDHVASILLVRAVGLRADQLNYVPFLSGAEGKSAAADEKVGAVMMALSELAAEVAVGRLRILGVSSSERLEGVDAPTLAEAGIPLQFANWRGVAARPGLPADQQLRLAALVYGATLSSSWQTTLENRKWKSSYLGPEPFQAFVRQEYVRLKEALNAVGLLKRRGE
jgi:putative tricarboxylic transport membrane protein